MRAIFKQYVETHWWAFLLEGVVAGGFGLFALFNNIKEIHTLAIIVSIVLMFMGALEVLRSLMAIKTQKDWGLSLFIALAEVAVGAFVLLNRNGEVEYLVVAISAYMIARGIFDCLVALISFTFHIDRFMWVLSGIVGTVLGFVALASGDYDGSSVFWILGSYMLVFGVTDMIYAIHARFVLKDIEETIKRPVKKKKISS
ncbi:MAG: DUF308 domain-containing protein [Candidatus Nomurabacteria bacterium]|jgi:uncharacterized membrane protein HdeD (DUF308 family)|nr:DUF308 domain-containing protein [Candidatus Nomurabacteria bacterium]